MSFGSTLIVGEIKCRAHPAETADREILIEKVDRPRLLDASLNRTPAHVTGQVIRGIAVGSEPFGRGRIAWTSIMIRLNSIKKWGECHVPSQ